MATANEAETARPASTAADIMTPGPRTCSPFSRVAEAAALFKAEGCAVLPVVDAGKPVGIVTDHDMAVAIAEYPDLPSRPISEIMTKRLITASPEETLAVVRDKLAEAPGRSVLVINPDGTLRGLVGWKDLAARLPDAEVAGVVSVVVDRADVADGRTASLAKPRVAPEAEREAAAGPWGWLQPLAFLELIKVTVREWSEDKVPRLGAALAFYSLLSMAPLVLIAVSLVGLVFGDEAAQGRVVEQLDGLIGRQGAEAVQEVLAHADQRPGLGSVAAIVGVLTLLFAASGVFGALQDALNTIWEVQSKPGRGLWGVIQGRFLSFAMVLGTGFLLLVSLILTAVLNAAFGLVGGIAPWLAPVAQVANTLVSFAVITLLFAMIFKVLPDAKIAWRDVWIGAVLTTVLFLAGKSLIGLYLGRSSFGSAYGAAGSLVALVVWIYYSAQILFFGAEFTQVFANRHGSRIRPARGAEPVTEAARAQQGMPHHQPAGT